MNELLTLAIMAATGLIIRSAVTRLVMYLIERGI